ncbi:hypothetical protein MDAP_000622 [Mitosporidium daphniae]|uniref:SHSP domain-containing protein n=1 Tax=Mitosporidium daphniae TaxID=1485682 RepID=A0A098VUB8_9MICR|nr:uncharacterized protein DI09_15p390 [Mitosporidium daphniae]KGG52572.1 hypothetical protein DI09_15p390 [Mitosporidium daphniae]|eukprot:XP_013238999.1 uncharacterized protein DI09_15p390 [Mitosporidium daphniae]
MNSFPAKMSLALLKIFLILALIAGVWNDYPAFKNIPDLQTDGPKKIQSQIEKQTPHSVKSKLENIKEGMMERLQKCKDETAHLMDKDDLLGNLGQWKDRLVQDVETLWSQVSEQLKESKNKVMAEEEDPHSDISAKLHKLFGKLMPDALFTKESEERINNLEEGEKMMVVDVSGCSANDLKVTISGDKRMISIRGTCAISESNRGPLIQKEIDEKLRVPSQTNVENITVGLKNGLLCIIFPPLDLDASEEQILLAISEW